MIISDGMKIYISSNNVILTEGFDGVVPVKYFQKIETWPGRQVVPFWINLNRVLAHIFFHTAFDKTTFNVLYKSNVMFI